MLALLLVSGSLSAQTQGAVKRVRHVSRFELAVACIKKYEGLHGPKHHPYVGYGHKLLPGERLSPRMTERHADALLRSDLRKLCAMFRGFGRDSLLLAALAYNVGCGKVMKIRSATFLSRGAEKKVAKKPSCPYLRCLQRTKDSPQSKGLSYFIKQIGRAHV